jgi:tetratricopeptide (TPR) repeat protein
MLGEVARLREQGHRLVRRRKYNEAEKPLRQGLQLVQRILDERPGAETKEKALYQEYRCYELLGRPIAREDSFKAYLALVRRRGGDDAAGRVLVEDGHRLIRQRDMTVAGRRLNRALVLCPKGRTAVAAHVLLGLAAERQLLYDLAHSQYQTALAMKPPPELAVKIARTMLSISAAQDRTDAALADARKLCALADEHLPPKDRLQPQWLLARLLAEKGKTVQAARLFRGIAAAGHSPMAQVARLELQRLAGAALDIEEGIP